MAGDSTVPSWQCVNNNSNFVFTQEHPVHVPRAWERAPQPSHIARHKGRKVWKRPEIRTREDVERHEAPAIDEQRNPLRDLSSNTPRPVKRLRVKDGMAKSGNNEGGGFANYFATLRDGAMGTPKRKGTIPDIEKPPETQESKEEPGVTTEVLEQPNEGQIPFPEIDVAEDLLNVPESPAQADVRNLLETSDSPAVEVKQETDLIVNGKFLMEREDAQHIGSESIGSKGQPEPPEVIKKADETVSPKIILDIHRPKETNEPISLHPRDLAESSTEAQAADDDKLVSQRKSPLSVAKHVHLQSTLAESPQGLNSPQIGTTLLRRESLRSKGSPRKRGSAKKNASPHKSHGLKKRDTLQEREILQQFNAASSPTNATITANLIHEAENASPSKLSPGQFKVPDSDIQQVTTSPELCRDQLPSEASADTLIGAVPVDQIILKDKDIGRALEAIEVCQNANDGPPDAGFNDASLSAEANNNIDQANDFIARSEIQEAVQSVTAVGDDINLPTRKTRSGARISDDTSMLKDFLNRAQAKKAAKNVPLLSAEVPNLQNSPTRRSPRKALEPQYGEIGSPQKKKKSTRGPSTPPRKVLVEEDDSSDDQETICEPASFRRSTRTRLPAPSKTPPGAPTFIPVRRGEGSDPIVLQKSQAQEMAIVTRANTRRNKGQSKPPALALQDLPPESPIKLTSKERADYAKKVAWAEKLASFQESKDTPEEPEEQQRPKVRRMRGLGAVNGTPAKKSTAMAPSSNGTPAPKRRSKTR